MNIVNFSRAKSYVITAGVALIMSVVAPIAQTGGEEKPYKVVCNKDPESGATGCKVDKKTYIGWRTFHSTCHVCHGQNALGSSFAPSLVDRLKDISKEQFMDTVANGRTFTTASGQPSVMPAWKDNPNVNTRFEDLYAYLKARADGALPGVRPQRMDR